MPEPATTRPFEHQAFASSSIATVIATVVAVAVIAYAADDAVHELLGHGSACLALGIKVLSISTVGLQTAESSRLVAAAGSVANVLAGTAALFLAGRARDFSWRYFLWLFGFINLMNGTGYLMASAMLDSGDWAVVVAGFHPPLLWRIGMGLIGVVLFSAVVRWASSTMAEWIIHGTVTGRDLARLTVPPYMAGGALFIAAATLNPLSPSLILASGAGASLGLTFGLLLIPGMVKGKTEHPEVMYSPLQLSKSWMVSAPLVAVIFIGIFGRGIRLP